MYKYFSEHLKNKKMETAYCCLRKYNIQRNFLESKTGSQDYSTNVNLCIVFVNQRCCWVVFVQPLCTNHISCIDIKNEQIETNADNPREIVLCYKIFKVSF